MLSVGISVQEILGHASNSRHGDVRRSIKPEEGRGPSEMQHPQQREGIGVGEVIS